MSIASDQQIESGHVSYATFRNRSSMETQQCVKLVIIYKKSTGGSSTNALTIHKTMHLIISSDWTA
jgi:ATP-dependent protease ClpP protease subunit